MPELDIPVKTTASIDTNAEYILPGQAKKQPPVLKSVARSIVIETIKDFFGSIIGFFLRYVRHFVRCFQYFISPSLKKKPFNALDFKENSQHAFEFVIIVLAILIFMIKVGWIPPSDQSLKEVYSDDLKSKGMDLFLFLVFALAYLVMSAISIFIGRFFRRIFKINTTLDESDILHVYLNNAFFSIAAIITLILRSIASTEVYETDSIVQVIMMIVFPSIMIPLLVWCGRFASLHGLKVGKGILFYLLSFFLFSLTYGISITLVCAFAIGI